MKKSALVCLACLLIFSKCRKDIQPSNEFQNRNSFVQASIDYLKDHLSHEDLTKLDFHKSTALQYHGTNLAIQVFEKGHEDKFILLQNKKGEYSGNWIDMSAFKMMKPKCKSGIIVLTDLHKDSVTKLIVDSNEVVKVIDSNLNSHNIKIHYPVTKKYIATRPSIFINFPYVVLPEIVIYATSGTSDYGSLYWLTNQNSYYSGLYYPNYGTGGGSSPGYGGYGSGGSSSIRGVGFSNNVIATPSFLPPAQPIVDFLKEVACFTNSSNSTYSIDVNVNQPEPNSREVINAFANFPVGHTFLTLQQFNADGTVVTRNIGFYPKNGVKLWNTNDQSIFGDDSNTLFDISLNISVSGLEFMTVINSLSKQQSIQYDMDNFNCTNSSIDAFNSINVHLPATKSTDFQFHGNDPADLGEDLKGLDLNKFSAANGNRKVTRTVSNFNDKKPPVRKG